MNIGKLEDFGMGIFMLLLTPGVSVLVYGGMQKDKFDIKKYNKEKSLSPAKRKRDALTAKICGCIMLHFLLRLFYHELPPTANFFTGTAFTARLRNRHPLKV